MNYYNNPYNKYNRIKRNKYLDSLTKRFAVATLIFLLALLLKVTNYYNGSTLIFKVENYLNKDYTEYADRFMKDSDIIQTFSNKVLKKRTKIFFN
ncbi:hypothetical protein [Thermobrachium celere]|uniref:hypothetical protein n=1 Tax=Thermobrachium celere TaxID=53422 RepID=UPI0019424CC7|nr:hypothetical protein [Thermobrachium celere]GFR36534.1 hypothetical protein TCEA9_23460 [Thermobrachium celere]